ncbi:acyltransferase [Halomonadaceae bacterium KBTZ08]
MLNLLPKPLLGVLNSLLLAVNTVFWCVLLYIPAILKLIIPIRGWRVFCTRLIIWISQCWVACNSGWMRLAHRTTWDVSGLEGLSREGWYLVMSNHQSWVDIFALQHIFNRRIPFLKFFLKQELIWVPVIGLAWWGLDFPFMKRYSREYLEKHPEKRGEDMKATQRACEKFKYTPVSVMNFPEGTRFTPAKHAAQQSPYKHLLRPKAGGTAFVLEAMGDTLSTMLDITIAYPNGRPGLWEFMCGRVTHIVIRVEQVPIPEHLRGGDDREDGSHRQQVKEWQEGLWERKDQLLDELKARAE